MDKTSEINFALLMTPTFSTTYVETEHKVWKCCSAYYYNDYTVFRENFSWFPSQSSARTLQLHFHQSLSQETWCMCGWLSILLIQQDLCISKQRHSELQCHCWHGCLNYEFIRIFWIHAPGTKKSSFATKHFFFSAHCTCCKNYYWFIISTYILYSWRDKW